MTLIGCGFWAAWAPADLVALDLLTFDALTAADHTNPKKGLPTDAVRSIQDGIHTHEFPKQKTNIAAGSCTWNQQDEYRSHDEDSIYVLDFTLNTVTL